MSTVDVVLASVGSLVLIIGLFSRLLRQSVVSDNVIALGAGVILGPSVTGLIVVSDWGETHSILNHAARVTLAIGLMEVALRLPKHQIRQYIRPTALLLGLIMPLMFLTSAGLAALIFGFPLAIALLVGAIITPTDPIVSSSIVTGPVAQKEIPSRLRTSLSSESGFNDGLSLPFVALGILLLPGTTNESVGHWLVRVIGWEIGAGTLIGIAIGYVAAKMLKFSERHYSIEREAFLVYTVALSLATLGIAALAGTDGILSVFIAGVAFHLTVQSDEDTEEGQVQSGINRFFSLPIFALLGAAIPLSDWAGLGWQAALFVVAVLLFRRLPAILLTSRWMKVLHSRPDALFLGWFGPIGIAALYYATHVMSESENQDIWAISTLVICTSVVIHGMTATPFSHWYRRKAQQAEGNAKN